jgi:nucleotide-binding universal stress UspA family protein
MTAHQPSPIVVGFDGSPQSTWAIDWAAREASLLGAPLVLVHAFVDHSVVQSGVPGMAFVPYPSHELRTRAEHRCRGVVESLLDQAPGLVVTEDVVAGDPARALVEHSRTARLLVMGGRGRGPVKGFVLGSTCARVVAHAVCPTVVVHERASTTLPDLRVVLGVDGLEDCAAATRFAFEEADRRGAGLTVVHTWDVDLDGAAPSLTWAVDRDEAQEQERMALAASIAGYRSEFPGVDVRSHVVRAHPVEQLARQSENAALLVVGTRGRSRLTALTLGSVSLGVLARAHCPVAVVPRAMSAEAVVASTQRHHLPVPPVRDRP